MTEPYPSTEVESKLKHLFRSLTRAHRAYKDTRNHALTLLHRASAAVLTAVLVYKVLTYLLFLPAMNGIWSLTLHCSPRAGGAGCPEGDQPVHAGQPLRHCASTGICREIY